MNILVCIKQVPGTSNVKVDPVTGVLKRDGIDTKMNPYDIYALETALKIKEMLGGKVTVITMGPPQAKAVIKEAFSMGADEGVIISDRKFAGADVLATSYTISQGIKKSGDFDLILCGKQTTDGDTAQVGAEIAEYLGIAHVSNVKKLLKAEKDMLGIEADISNAIEILDIKLPCLLTVEKDIFSQRFPSYLKLLASENKIIKEISLIDFEDKDENKYGLSGSPTQVERIFPPENNKEREQWTGSSEELTLKITNKLKELKFI